MQFIVSADDYALSKGITDGILDAFDNGFLTSFSIIPNGVALDYAIEQYKNRTGIRLSVHINLLEGNPVCHLDAVNMLVNKRGELRCSFQLLWLKYLKGSAVERQELKHQVKLEMKAQIQRILDCFDNDFVLCVDGHQHVHMIPFVFDALMELHDELSFSYVRVIDEPFTLVWDGAPSIKSYFGPNLAKYLILKGLSYRAKRILKEKGIRYCEQFVGILFTGMMSQKVVQSAFSKIRRGKNANDTIEFLLHPGGAVPGEEWIWKERESLRKVYFSPWRRRELEAVKDLSFRELFASPDK